MTYKPPTPSREIQYISAVTSSCALNNDGDLMGLYQVGHWPPWDLRQEAQWEHCGGDEPGWPTRTWWIAVPYSLAYPDEEACGDGPESEVFIKARRDHPLAFPVTVLYF